MGVFCPAWPGRRRLTEEQTKGSRYRGPSILVPCYLLLSLGQPKTFCFFLICLSSCTTTIYILLLHGGNRKYIYPMPVLPIMTAVTSRFVAVALNAPQPSPDLPSRQPSWLIRPCRQCPRKNDARFFHEGLGTQSTALWEDRAPVVKWHVFRFVTPPGRLLRT